MRLVTKYVRRVLKRERPAGSSSVANVQETGRAGNSTVASTQETGPAESSAVPTEAPLRDESIAVPRSGGIAVGRRFGARNRVWSASSTSMPTLGGSPAPLRVFRQYEILGPPAAIHRVPATTTLDTMQSEVVETEAVQPPVNTRSTGTQTMEDGEAEQLQAPCCTCTQSQYGVYIWNGETVEEVEEAWAAYLGTLPDEARREEEEYAQEQRAVQRKSPLHGP